MPQQGLASEGKLLWQKYNCNACHQIYGLGGYLGPDLTNVYSHKGKGPDYIRTFLQHGTDIMPDFKLNDTEVNALVTYLQAVDATGTSDPKTFKIHADGTIEQ
jgi:nitric oxide reductase subunit C